MSEIIKEIYGLSFEKCYNDTFFDSDTVGCEGYGETGYDSFNIIISKYSDYFNDNTIFYDLGSGFGKIVFHVGIMCNAKKSCGIEYSEKRYEQSVKLLEKYNYENVVFINDNFLNVDLSDATVIYLDNTLFPTNIDNQIYNKIPKNCIVFSRKMLRQSKINNELIKENTLVPTNYGTFQIYVMIKK